MQLFSDKTYFTIDNEKIVKEVPIYRGDFECCGYKKEIVMTKDAFIECYNKWIKEANNELQ